MRAARLGPIVFLLAALCQCRGEPAPSLSPAAPPAPPAGAPAPVPVPSASPDSAPSEAPATAAAPSVSAAPPNAEVAEPALLSADGTPLPQTEERPSVTSPLFLRRMQRLADAILTGDVERARDTFFPLVAYAQVKDVQKPERDYRYRLMAHFERDVREYRKALGRDAGRAEFLGVSVPEERVQWMKPGKEGNRLGYFRVLRSRLRFRMPTGKEQSLELTSMISWRGEWYVVHLHGFD
ncbi:MAG: hypothetical protein K0R38_1188 [Polyangiaceae bacterium]|nr:hypothetical protein [Polyangiaceae bacterium]